MDLPAERLGRTRSTYVRHRPEDAVLHRVVRDHRIRWIDPPPVETFLAEVARLGKSLLLLE
jgi:hypothetical protein